jgi:selenocysteine lyase/cysteine desulfurase
MADSIDSAGHAPDVAALRGEIIGIDQTVPLADGTCVLYACLDNAATTPCLRAVQDKVEEFLSWYSSVHRGAGFKSMLSSHAYEESRRIVAEFVGADTDYHTVIFGKNATEAINKLSNRIGLQPDDVVLATVMEHHSNDLPWRGKARVEYVGVRPDGSLDTTDLARKLERLKGKVRVVAVTAASNVTGFINPIHDIAELAHQHGAKVVADCAQLAPHRAIRMGPVGLPRSLDFVVMSAHKMYAPFGSGALIGPSEVFREGAPDYKGGGTIDVVSLDEVSWAEPPDRDEAGTPNTVGAVALATSIRTLSKVGMDAITKHENALTNHALRELNRIDGIRVFGSSDPNRLEDRLGVIPFEVAGVPHGQVASVLAFEGGIGVRSGCFCAHPYVTRLLGLNSQAYEAYKARILNHDRSTAPGLVRISFGCYNTIEEIDRLTSLLRRVVSGDYSDDYVVDKASGLYLPRSFYPGILESCFKV